MAYVLSTTVLVAGTEPTAIALLGTYKHLSTLATPVTEASIRADLETSQVQPFTNEGWTIFVGQMSNLPLDDSLLTAAEASIVNTFREVVSPDPALDCCGVVTPIIGSTKTWEAIPRVGSATWEHEFLFGIPDDTDCDIKSVDITLTPVLGPAITSTVPFKALFKKCEGGFRYYSFFWVTFAANPSGFGYTVALLDYKDADDITITSYAPSPSAIVIP